MTLTYGRDPRYDAADHVRAAVLTYRDVQKFLKRLRKEGLSVRYFIVGEYGSMKGRTHWHALLFWQGAVPIVPLGENVEFRHWPHGHTFWDRLNPETIAYVCKYVAKEVAEEGRLYHVGLSRRPPLGDAYFRLLAANYVAQRLAPQDWVYQFAGVEKKGRQRKFVMRGKTRENFIRYFRDGWWEAYGDHPPNSEILEKFEDKQAELGSQDEAKRVLAAEKAGLLNLRDSVRAEPSTHRPARPRVDQLRSWMDPARLMFSETLNVWLYVFDGEQRPWYWAMDDEGEWGWRSKIGARGKNDATGDYRLASRGR